MCVWAGVSRSGFYDWLTRPASASVARRRELEVIVAHLFQDCDGTYGYRRLHAELVRGQVPCSLELRGVLAGDAAVSPAQVLHACVTSREDLGAALPCDAAHRSPSGREPAVVCPHRVVRVLLDGV
jgi:putative transposase